MWAPEQHVQPEQTFSYWLKDYDDVNGDQHFNGLYGAQLVQGQTHVSVGQYGAPHYEDLTTIEASCLAADWHQQDPCPTTETPIPSVVDMQTLQYIELQPFTLPSNAVSALTYNGLPVFIAEMNPLPTCGGQNEDCVLTVQPEPPARPIAPRPPAPPAPPAAPRPPARPIAPRPPAAPAVPVKAPVSKKVKKPKEKKVEEGPYIKKPPNAFMLFLKEHRKSAEEELGVRTSAAVNKLLGERWKALPVEDKSLYNIEARFAALLHHEQNPGWTNKNNYAKKRKRNGTVIKRVGVSTC